MHVCMLYIHELVKNVSQNGCNIKENKFHQPKKTSNIKEKVYTYILKSMYYGYIGYNDAEKQRDTNL